MVSAVMWNGKIPYSNSWHSLTVQQCEKNPWLGGLNKKNNNLLDRLGFPTPSFCLAVILNSYCLPKTMSGTSLYQICKCLVSACCFHLSILVSAEYLSLVSFYELPSCSFSQEIYRIINDLQYGAVIISRFLGTQGISVLSLSTFTHLLRIRACNANHAADGKRRSFTPDKSLVAFVSPNSS